MNIEVNKSEVQHLFSKVCAENDDGDRILDYRELVKQIQKADYDISDINRKIKDNFDIKGSGADREAGQTFDLFANQKKKPKTMGIKQFYKLLFSSRIKLPVTEVRDAFNR